MKVMLALAGSSILYHIIDLRYAVQSMRNDKFLLAPTLTNSAERQHGDGDYFMSLTRSKTNDYFAKNIYNGNRVVFVLDGDKLGHQYKIKAVNYWSRSPSGNATNSSQDDEMEDRLFANTKNIPCLKYIKEIHFSMEGEGPQNQSRELAIIAKRNKIPLFQYANPRDMITLSPTKRIDLKTRAPRLERFGTSKSSYGRKFTNEAEAWWDAIAYPNKPELDPYKTFVDGAKDKDRRKYRARVYDELKNGLRYGPESALSTFNQHCGTRYSDGDTHIEKIAKYMRRNKLDALGLLKELIQKFGAHDEQKKTKALEEAKAKFPLPPTFYIYKTDTGYRLDVENYPELNRESDNVDELTDVAYDFHRKSRNIYDNYNARIERMF